VALRGGGRVSDGCSTAPASAVGLLGWVGLLGLRRR
jgi:MYXO-CTERM domain-containing protein